MNAQIYTDSFMRFIVNSYIAAVGYNFTLMDDNARPHHDRLVGAFLNEEDMERMDWPAYYLDLHPSEHVWYYLGRLIREAAKPP